MSRNHTIQSKSTLLILAASFVVAMAAGIPCQAADSATSFAFPEGRAGDVAAAFLYAFNSDGDSLIAAFHETYLSKAALAEHPLNQQLWQYGHMSGMLGKLTVKKVVEKKASSLVLLVESEEIGAYFHLGLELDGGSPRMLNEFFIRPAPKAK